MRAGASGKIGVLQLDFGLQRGTTRLVSNYATGPQRVQRALYPDPALPDMAFAFIQSVSGGVLQGDRLAIDVHVSDGARAHVTTQAASKIYRMDRNYATQRVTMTVEPGAYLEYLPDFVIPYRCARFYQEIGLQVADEGTLVIADLIAPGRVASGEAFRFDILCTRTQAHNLHGKLRFTDYLRLQPADTRPDRPGLLDGHSYYASLLVLTKQVSPDRLVAHLHEVLDGTSVVAGASCLPQEDGAVLRLIGTTGPAVEAAILSAWSAWRTLLLRAPAPKIHRIKYGSQPTLPLSAPAKGGNSQ
jgi:urease accessory protein